MKRCIREIIRFKINDLLLANIAMKTNLIILDVMEFGIGYSWN